MPINKKLIIYLIFTISLFVGFLFEENSSGGPGMIIIIFQIQLKILA